MGYQCLLIYENILSVKALTFNVETAQLGWDFTLRARGNIIAVVNEQTGAAMMALLFGYSLQPIINIYYGEKLT